MRVSHSSIGHLRHQPDGHSQVFMQFWERQTQTSFVRFARTLFSESTEIKMLRAKSLDT